MKKRRILLGLALASASMFTLASCGGVENNDGSKSTEASSAATSSAASSSVESSDVYIPSSIESSQSMASSAAQSSQAAASSVAASSAVQSSQASASSVAASSAAQSSQEAASSAAASSAAQSSAAASSTAQSSAAQSSQASQSDPVTTCIVSFDASNGSAVNTVEVNKGETVDEPSDPYKEGFEFAGWYLNDSLFKFNTPITSSITLRAKWNVASDTTTVGFGGSYTSWATLFAGSTQKDEKDRTILGTTGTYVEMNNFEFDGKCLLDGGILNTNASTIKINLPSNGSINMTATWGSSTDSGVIRVYKDGTQIYESSSTYSKSNSNISLDLTGLSAGTYEIKAEKTNTTGMAGMKVSKIFYEKLKEYVNVSFVTNCDVTINPIKVEKGKTVSIPQITNSGYKLVGWYTDSGFNTEFNEADAIDENTVLYANWRELEQDEIATVTFDSNITEATINPVNVEKGKTIVLPTIDVTGYRLEGWYTNAARTNPFVTSTVINDNMTIYAKFVKVWTVTYLDYDDTVLSSITVDNGTKFSSLAKLYPTYPDGKVFMFWSEDGENEIVDTTEITSAVTLKPVYKNDDGTTEKIVISSAEGSYESATLKVNAYTGATDYALFDVTGGKNIKLTQDDYYVIPSTGSFQIEVFGLTKGAHTFLVAPVIGGSEVQGLGSLATVDVTEYDRSGYAHFNYNEGVGAYNDDGTLKDNAIVLYVTDENKNTINLSFHDSVNNKDWSVTGIGNILNSAGKEYNGTGLNSKGGLANTNGGVILALAQNKIPLVVRFVGCVSNSGLYKDGTFNANSTPLINGLTQYDGVDWGGSDGDNGHMARMQSGKDITFEGVGNDAIIDGWGFHLICESAYTEYAKSFEVRNLTFINTPEDAVGMEGQEIESTMTITAPVERCWVHHNTFICPHISNAAASDKGEGDGSCDFKRGRYFTCSYNYFENCHKTNLVGSGKTSVQYCLTYHHNLWYQCAARQPLARKANIHFYNNYIIGTSDTVSSLRADAYMFAEKNYYLGCSRPVEYKAEGGSTGVCKAYENNVIGCFNNYDATDVTNREDTITANCKDNATNIDYSTFDTNSELFYYDSVNKKSDCYLTDANQARIDCIEQAGSRYRTNLNKVEYGTSTDVTTTASSATVSGATSLTFEKGKGILKVFTVTKAVTVTMAASASAGFDTGYLLKMDGTVVLELKESTQTAVLLPGKYVVMSCIAFTPNGKNDKETTVTTCTFEEYNSEELNQQLIQEYQTAHDAIPATITYTDACYNAITNAMAKYEALGDLKSQITNYSDVTTAYNSYKSLGVAYVEAEINKIVTPVTASNSNLVISARNAYDSLIAKISDAQVSNLSTLTAAEEAMSSLSVDIFLNQVNALPATITYTNECLTAITNAETAYAKLDDTQKNDTNVKTAYATLTAARAKYDSLAQTAAVDELLDNASTIAECETAYEEYNKLSADEKAIIGDETISQFKVKYTIALINSISNPVVRADKTNVDKARTLYDSLGSSYQAQVTNYATLTAAEEALAGMSAQEVTKTLSASDFTITGASTTAFNGNVWKGESIVGISKVTFTDPSKVVLNATRYDGSVSFKVSYSTDGTTWTEIGTQQPKSNKTAQDLEYTITQTGDLYIKVEIVCTKDKADNAKQGTISSIKITCYE